MKIIKFVILAGIITALLTAAGCGAKVQPDFDMQELADKLLDEVNFEATPAAITEKEAKELFGIKKANKIIAYKAETGYDAVAVILANSAEEAEEIFYVMVDYINAEKAKYTESDPTLAERIGAPVLKWVGNSVIYCSSGDYDNAKAIVDAFVSAETDANT